MCFIDACCRRVPNVAAIQEKSNIMNPGIKGSPKHEQHLTDGWQLLGDTMMFRGFHRQLAGQQDTHLGLVW